MPGSVPIDRPEISCPVTACVSTFHPAVQYLNLELSLDLVLDLDLD